ncbi:MAG: hypothetical protein ACLQVY_23565 [Limisphaerales bacterium]
MPIARGRFGPGIFALFEALPTDQRAKGTKFVAESDEDGSPLPAEAARTE